MLIMVLTFAVGLPPVPEHMVPREVRGIYLTGWVAGDAARRADLYALVRRAGMNAVVIDVKDSSGNEFADSGAVAAAHEAGLYAIARIVSFENGALAAERPDLAFQLDGRVWLGESGLPWVDPRKEATREALVALALKAVAMGFDEVQLDYVRFPTGPGADRLDRGDAASRVAAIDVFLREMRAALPDRVRLSADLFGLTTTAVDDMNIGQDLRAVAKAVDVVSPMMYPSHYAPNSYGFPDPDLAPRGVILAGLADALVKVDGRAAQLRPWLQAFSLGHPYGLTQVRAQIDAASERGVKSYLLWDPANRYDMLR